MSEGRRFHAKMTFHMKSFGFEECRIFKSINEFYDARRKRELFEDIIKIF